MLLVSLGQEFGMGTARMMGLHSIYLGLTGEGLNSGSNAVAGIAIS